MKDVFSEFLDGLFEKEPDAIDEQEKRLRILVQEQYRIQREVERLRKERQQLQDEPAMDPREKLLRDILRVRYDATEDELDYMYKRLAVKLHPDKNPGDPKANERFKRMARAYELLKERVSKQEGK